MTAETPAIGIEEIPSQPAAVDPDKKRRRKRGFLLFFLFLMFFLLAALIGLAVWYLLFRQPIAPTLPGLPDMRLPSFATALYNTNKPMGVAVSPDGSRIYVADTGDDRAVKVFDAQGTLLRTATLPESEGAEHVPLYIAIDPLTSEVYASDRPTGEIYVYDQEGNFIRRLTLADDVTGWQPIGIAFDKDGVLYVADLGAAYPRVVVIGRDAKVARTMGESDRMSFINGLAVDGNGYVYVADSNNGRLMVYDKTGALAAQVGRGVGDGKLGLPRGVAVDGNRVYVVDSTGQGVSIFRQVSDPAAGRLDYIGYVGGEGVADGRFAFPNGVAVDGRGRIYIADTSNDRVQLWSY